MKKLINENNYIYFDSFDSFLYTVRYKTIKKLHYVIMKTILDNTMNR